MFGGGSRKRIPKSAKKPRHRKTSKAKRVKKGTRKGMRRKSARRAGLRLAYDFAKPRRY